MSNQACTTTLNMVISSAEAESWPVTKGKTYSETCFQMMFNLTVIKT